MTWRYEINSVVVSETWTHYDVQLGPNYWHPAKRLFGVSPVQDGVDFTLEAWEIDWIVSDDLGYNIVDASQNGSYQEFYLAGVPHAVAFSIRLYW